MSIEEIRKNHELAERMFHESDAHQDRAELLRVIDAVLREAEEAIDDKEHFPDNFDPYVSIEYIYDIQRILRGEGGDE